MSGFTPERANWNDAKGSSAPRVQSLGRLLPPEQAPQPAQAEDDTNAIPSNQHDVAGSSFPYVVRLEHQIREPPEPADPGDPPLDGDAEEPEDDSPDDPPIADP